MISDRTSLPPSFFNPLPEPQTNVDQISHSSLRELGRFIVSGLVGSAVGFFTYQLIWFCLPDFPAQATAAWFISYHVAVVRQHWLHCRFTFQAMKGRFWSTFGRAYAAYAFGLVITTACHYLVSETLQLGGNIAWIACYAVAIVMNFPLLKHLVYRSPATHSKAP